MSREAEIRARLPDCDVAELQALVLELLAELHEAQERIAELEIEHHERGTPC